MSNVDHPNHYQSESGLEVIDVIKAFTSELLGEEAFCIGNAIKYVCRYSKKNGVEDLEKAKWYIDRAISVREGQWINVAEYCNNDVISTEAVFNATQKEEFRKTRSPMADVKSADNIGRFLFASREEANKVVKELQSMIHEHGYVTLADLHDRCELAVPSPDCEDVGWQDAGDFRIIPTNDGWELTFYVWPENIKHD